MLVGFFPVPKPRGLTPKQAKFCALVAGGQRLSEAYRQAYNADHMKDASVRTESSKLSKLPHVASAIENLKANHRPTQRTVQVLKEDWIVERLEVEAMDEKNPSSSRVRALSELGKIRGLYEAKKTVAEHRSPEEIRRELKEKLKEFFGEEMRNPE